MKKNTLLLVIDIGNTNVTLAVFSAERRGSRGKPLQVWRLATNAVATADEYGPMILNLFAFARLQPSRVAAIAIASVVPPLDRPFADVAAAYFNRTAFFVTSATLAGITLAYRDPSEIGADRIADAAAAYARYGGPSVVIDFGTATTFDCITAAGEYRGGVIAPGPLISAESLARRTAKLPQVTMVKPVRVIGRSTVESIQSGLYYGYIGLIKEILVRLAADLGGKPTIIATGGLAGLIVPEISAVKYIEPDLTLEGIRIIWETAAHR
jgi:type III pantothenate kinase